MLIIEDRRHVSVGVYIKVSRNNCNVPGGNDDDDNDDDDDDGDSDGSGGGDDGGEISLISATAKRHPYTPVS